MTTPLSDPLVAPLLVQLRDCVRTELARAVAGPVCRCAVAHSVVTPTMDGCDCECDDGQGDAWVRLVRLEPDETLEGIGPAVCPTGWQAVIELGVYRCVPLPEEGEALEEQVVSDIALAALSDMNALIRVLGCCSALWDTALGVEFWQPVGPAGGCAGGTLQFRVAISGGPGAC